MVAETQMLHAARLSHTYDAYIYLEEDVLSHDTHKFIHTSGVSSLI